MKIRNISFTPHLDEPLNVRTVAIDFDRVVVIDGPFTNYRSVQRGYQYHTTLTIYTDVAGLSYNIVVTDSVADIVPSANFRHYNTDVRFIPQCESYVKDLLEDIHTYWGR